MDINNFLIENMFDGDTEVVNEYKVDSNKKEKLIKDTVKKIQSMVNKEKALSKCIRFMQPDKIAKTNLSLIDKWKNRNNYTNKSRYILIGAYDFTNKDGANYTDLKDIITDFNTDATDVKLLLDIAEEDTMEGVFWNMLIPGLGSVAVYKNIKKRGVIKLSIAKKAIKESSGLEYANYIMESLFNEDSEYITEWQLNSYEKKNLLNAIKVTRKYFKKNASFFKDTVEIYDDIERAAEAKDINLKTKMYKAKGIPVGNFKFPANNKSYINKLDDIIDNINNEILPAAKISRNAEPQIKEIKGKKGFFATGYLKISFTRSDKYVLAGYEFNDDDSESIEENTFDFSNSIMESLFNGTL